MRRILLAAAAAFLTMFVSGGTWNAVVMAGFYANQAPANARLPEEQLLLALIVGYVLLTFFMTFLYVQSFSHRPSWGASFQFGVLFGLIATLPLYLILYAIWDFSAAYLIVDSIWHLVEQGIGAMILGAVLFARTNRVSVSG